MSNCQVALPESTLHWNDKLPFPYVIAYYQKSIGRDPGYGHRRYTTIVIATKRQESWFKATSHFILYLYGFKIISTARKGISGWKGEVTLVVGGPGISNKLLSSSPDKHCWRCGM